MLSSPKRWRVEEVFFFLRISRVTAGLRSKLSPLSHTFGYISCSAVPSPIHPLLYPSKIISPWLGEYAEENFLTGKKKFKLNFVLSKQPTYMHTAKKNPIYVLPEKKLRSLSPNIHNHVSVIMGRYINCSQKHECRNWDWGSAVSFLVIFVSNFRYTVFEVWLTFDRDHETIKNITCFCSFKINRKRN